MQIITKYGARGLARSVGAERTLSLPRNLPPVPHSGKLPAWKDTRHAPLWRVGVLECWEIHLACGCETGPTQSPAESRPAPPGCSQLRHVHPLLMSPPRTSAWDPVLLISQVNTLDWPRYPSPRLTRIPRSYQSRPSTTSRCLCSSLHFCPYSPNRIHSTMKEVLQTSVRLSATVFRERVLNTSTWV